MSSRAGQAAISLYFQQADHYFSESKEKIIPISDMVPTHAANAALKLLDEATHWSQEAGRELTAGWEKIWMIGTPLWVALHRRSIGE